MDLELADGATVADAFAELSRIDTLGSLLDKMPVRMAVNRSYAEPDMLLAAGDELALIPPISGGADVQARVTDEELSLNALADLVGRPSAGAVVAFQGVTREVSSLHYEAYREMAQERIEQILRECVERHGLAAAAAEHRIGSVGLGRPSVIVAVSAPHRAEAFDGAREAIDRIKAEAPIWKREVEGDGSSSWVEGRPAPGPELRGEPAK